MIRKLNVNMAEITRLTRAGQLAEAMTLLHKLRHPAGADGAQSTAMGFLKRKPHTAWQHPGPDSQQTAPRLEALLGRVAGTAAGQAPYRCQRRCGVCSSA